MKSLYFCSFVVSVLFARFRFKVKRKSLYLCSRRILSALVSERKYMKCLIFWTADKDMKVKAWMWSSQLNTQPKRLKRNRKKFRLDQESNPDLCDDRTQRYISIELIKPTGEQAVAMIRDRFPIKSEFFQVPFQPLSFFIQLRGSFPLSYAVAAVHNSFWDLVISHVKWSLKW